MTTVDPPAPLPPVASVAYEVTSQAESVAANRRWWDADSVDYYTRHGEFLLDNGFRWCPEGLTEAEAQLLGDVRGKRVLEVGCGSAQCSRWLANQGAQAVGFDLSAGMLAQARRLGPVQSQELGLVQAEATNLPFADASFDLACSAFGAIPFVADGARLQQEVARVLRPGGRWVFAINHPANWSFLDDPDVAGLRVVRSYFDTRPYVERDGNGQAIYVNHHRTMSQRIDEIVGAGLVLEKLIEPEWSDGNDEVWGSWSPQRGALFPGTVIFCTRLPA